uniref:Retrotransposon Copia-like N-terminal domain-containing protein n=1 Tax=Lactuca sativa TaxID=4236 RepID=A0A9R1WWZ8_LACSA|nr:hypothetical protein LSAT_V11C800440430 [Lactuca sativa]
MEVAQENPTYFSRITRSGRGRIWVCSPNGWPHNQCREYIFTDLASRIVFHGSSSSDLNTKFQLFTIKLTSSNFLLWNNQIRHVLSYQNLLGQFDGSVPSPPTTIEYDRKTARNPAYETWYNADRKALLIIQSSLSEETMAKTPGYAILLLKRFGGL